MTSAREILDDLVDDAYLEHSAAAWGVVRARSVALLEELGLWRLPGASLPPGELAAALAVAAPAVDAFAWMLEAVAGLGAVRRTGGGGELHLYQPADRPPPAALEDAEREAARHAAGIGTSTELLDYVASRYPEFLRGERSGPTLLLKGHGLDLWESYFSAANPLYDIHNAACARTLASALAAAGRRRPHVVELGAGTGGGTTALVAELGRSLPGSRLTITDTAPSLLLRVAERLDPGDLELRRRRVDFNQPLAGQLEPLGPIDAFVAVNALHNAVDLPATLARLVERLEPGGCLVVSESICGADEQVHQDFVFNLLPQPPRHPEATPKRPGSSRFLTAGDWRQLFATLPFAGEVASNRRGPELALVALARRGG